MDKSALFKEFFTVLKGATDMQNSPLKKMVTSHFLPKIYPLRQAAT
jgi:hypothetical protein